MIFCTCSLEIQAMKEPKKQKKKKVSLYKWRKLLRKQEKKNAES